MKQFVPLPDSPQTCSYSLTGDIVLFGAGLFAEPVIHSIRQQGFTPRLLLDNSPSKRGITVAGIPVTTPEEARHTFPDATVIITAAPRHLSEIQNQVSSMGWKNVFDCSRFLASFEYGRETFDSGISQLHFNIDRYFYEYFSKFHPALLVVPSLDIVITERCSLRCRDCSNLMQFYTNPQDIAFEKLFRALDSIMEAVDHVLEFRVLGGETFMNVNAWKYIDRLRQYKNFTRIAVYSNGTIIPEGKNLLSLIHDDTYLRISDYGSISSNIQDMLCRFNNYRIAYDVQKVSHWQDCAEIRHRKRSPEELAILFSSCCANNTLTLLKGRLYHCPFAANGANIEALPDFDEDYIDIDLLTQRGEIRKAIFSMVREKPFYSACEYCAGRPDDDTPLPAAIQTPAPLPYRKFR